MKKLYYLCMAWALLGVTTSIWAQPPNSFFVIHCDPGFAHLFPKLSQMIAYATQKQVPLTLELSPQWVAAILADPEKVDSIRAWQAWGHEVGAHHHGIYHCFWDSLSNYPIDTIWAVRTDPYWVPPACVPGAHLGTLDTFYDQLDQLAGDSLLLTWGSSDEHPEVDIYPNVPYRTDGSPTDPTRAFSNPYTRILGPYTAGNQIWGPYTTCQIDYFFIDNVAKANSVKNLYLDTDFSSNYSTVGVVTHVFDFAGNPTYFYQWVNFISGKGCKTVRGILSQASCSTTAASPTFPHTANALSLSPNPTTNHVQLEWNGQADLYIYDLTGRMVYQCTQCFEQLLINTSDWVPGIYIVEMRNKEGRTVARMCVY